MAVFKGITAVFALALHICGSLACAVRIALPEIRSCPVYAAACFLRICLIAQIFMLCGCGLAGKNTDSGLAGEAPAAKAAQEWQPEPVPYKVEIEVDGPHFLKDRMKAASQLIQLNKEPPDSILALERRARLDRETALKLLQSQCYYDGEASYDIDERTKPVRVTLRLVAGPIYTVGHADVQYEPKPVIPEAFEHRYRDTGFWGLAKQYLPPPSFPKTVPGIEAGKPVVADDMLAAVESIPDELRKNGYPFAKLEKSVYTLNRAERHLNADITINPGLPAVMGGINFRGDKTVSQSYLRSLAPWQPGKECWDDLLLDEYANSLRALGLFRRVEAKPGSGQEGRAADEYEGALVVPADIDLVAGPPRSVSFGARYDSGTGFGVAGSWEHRNFFGSGEKLRLDAPISQEERGIKAHFEKPAFFDRDNRLLLDGALLWEDTEAYEQQLARASAGVERHLARNWWGSLGFFAEGGYLKDNEHERRDYEVLSPRANLRYDGRNNRLNPSQGMETELNIKPFYGFYEEDFGAFAATLMLAGYYAPLGRKNDGKIDDSLVLAVRAEGGAMPGASSLRAIPSSLRYYTGGAGSVRGYAYQAIGPRDSEGDPLGGRSYQVVNLESRFMVAKNIGIVPFLDGGMVYKDEYPRIFGAMDWGAGLGFRYYTPVGPIRLDMAAPFHYIDGDPPVQFYVSIGQSF